MDTRIIEVRKNILITDNVNTNTFFCQNINVDFIPDEVIVKYINYTTTVALEDGFLTFITTNLIPDNTPIGTFFANASIKCDTTFTLRKPISGDYRFTFTDFTGALDNTRVGRLAIHLEFVKYRTDLPDKKIF